MSSDTAATILDAARRPALLSYLRERRCVLFAGAGLSRAAGYPGWDGLMRTVVREAARGIRAGSGGRELLALVKAKRYAEVADQCRELLGRSRFSSLLRAELARPASPPESTHQPIVRTPYAAIVTTNFDTLLEDAYALWGDEGVPKAPTGAQLGRHGTLLLDRAFFILKAHGTIHDDASLVFTSEDYRRITHANPAFQSMMSAILLSHAVVFVGYSLSDPNFRLLIESQLSVFGAHTPPRYAVMEGVGKLEADILRRTAGIEVIAYPRDEHHNVGAFLSAIRSATEPRPPGRPARASTLRQRSPLPALRVSIRARGAMLDLEWVETSTDDLDGARVPLEKRWMGSTMTLPWAELAKIDGFTMRNMRETGALLGRPFQGVGVPFLAPGPPRLVMLDVSQELAALPWEWSLVEGQPLCMQTPVCRTVPGFDDASRGRPFFHSPLRVLLVGDALAESPNIRHPLPGTADEVRAIEAAFRKESRRNEVTVLLGKEASYERVLREMAEGYDVVHLSGVAYVDEFGESVVPLHDGSVRSSELATLLIRKPPGLLFVNEDCSGFVPGFGGTYSVPPSTSPDFADFYRSMQRHSPGLERVVARAGVGTFIGCMAPARESVARDVAVDFYSSLLEGEPLAHALYFARASREESERETAMLFAMSGYPDARIVAPRVPPVRGPGRKRPRAR